MAHPLFEKHRRTLEDAVAAIHTRSYWSAYPEVPSGKIYGATARDDGLAAFQARLGQPCVLDQPAGGAAVGDERSPYGIDLGITYPAMDFDQLMPAMSAAMERWAAADVETRIGCCLEALHQLNRRSFEMAFAVMHTTGQGFMMAFQAGGPHAQDRGLEAVAYAYDELSRIPAHATWSKKVSKHETVTLEKTFRIMPRGIAVNIGCSTFPTWNGYPGLFASLATGNAVIIKPHPGAVLPLAITVEVLRAVLAEQGFDPNVVCLAADTKKDPITKALVTRPEVRIVDYTGSSEFGCWIEDHARQAQVFTEKAGVNSAIIDSLDDLKAVTGNLAFTLSLYSGQMCTTSQNIFIPKGGIKVAGKQMSFDEVAGALVKAVDWFLSDPARASEVLGAVQNEATVQRINRAKSEGATMVRESTAMTNEHFPKARMFSPLILRVDAWQMDLYMREMFGPITYLVATDSTQQSIELAAQAARELGAITCALYSTDQAVIDSAIDATAAAGVPLSVNLTGQIFVNQSAAFSDYHVTGANPSGNATLCDTAFVAGRYRVVQSRVPVPQPAAETEQAHAGV